MVQLLSLAVGNLERLIGEPSVLSRIRATFSRHGASGEAAIFPRKYGSLPAQTKWRYIDFLTSYNTPIPGPFNKKRLLSWKSLLHLIPMLLNTKPALISTWANHAQVYFAKNHTHRSYYPHLFLFEFTHTVMNINTHAHSFLPGTHKHTLPPHLVNQTVFNTNHWPVDVSALLRGISSVQTLSPNTHTLPLSLSLKHTLSLTHTNSKRQTQSIIQDSCFGSCVFSYYFCSVVSIVSSGNLTARRPDEWDMRPDDLRSVYVFVI